MWFISVMIQSSYIHRADWIPYHFSITFNAFDIIRVRSSLMRMPAITGRCVIRLISKLSRICRRWMLKNAATTTNFFERKYLEWKIRFHNCNFEMCAIVCQQTPYGALCLTVWNWITRWLLSTIAIKIISRGYNFKW